jgi:NitT/TauT family transport system substrate-binding protein
VAFVRELIRASTAARSEPGRAQSLVVAASRFSEAAVAASWPHEAWPGGLAPDLLDVLVEEDAWVARELNRAPRPRAELARLIDDSVLKEAASGPR